MPRPVCEKVITGLIVPTAGKGQFFSFFFKFVPEQDLSRLVEKAIMQKQPPKYTNICHVGSLCALCSECRRRYD